MLIAADRVGITSTAIEKRGLADLQQHPRACRHSRVSDEYACLVQNLALRGEIVEQVEYAQQFEARLDAYVGIGLRGVGQRHRPFERAARRVELRHTVVRVAECALDRRFLQRLAGEARADRRLAGLERSEQRLVTGAGAQRIGGFDQIAGEELIDGLRHLRAFCCLRSRCAGGALGTPDLPKQDQRHRETGHGDRCDAADPAAPVACPLQCLLCSECSSRGARLLAAQSTPFFQSSQAPRDVCRVTGPAFRLLVATCRDVFTQ